MENWIWDFSQIPINPVPNYFKSPRIIQRFSLHYIKQTHRFFSGTGQVTSQLALQELIRTCIKSEIILAKHFRFTHLVCWRKNFQKKRSKPEFWFLGEPELHFSNINWLDKNFLRLDFSSFLKWKKLALFRGHSWLISYANFSAKNTLLAIIITRRKSWKSKGEKMFKEEKGTVITSFLTN